MVRAFLGDHAEFEPGRLAAPVELPASAAAIDARGVLYSSPPAHALDAFFAAVLVRRRAA